MSHHIYTTPAMVLASAPSREADRSYTLFTPQLGIVWATAQGIRREVSKLRYALQEFSVLSVSLVRGKEHWRITNASADTNIFWQQRTNRPFVEAIARIFRLLIRLVPGEEKSEQLYVEILAALHFARGIEFSDVAAAAFEHIVVLRILYNLGYSSAGDDLKLFLTDSWSQDLIVAAQKKRRSLVTTINFSLHQSQL